MTRINLGIPPKELVRQHLLAEHREIKRIPNLIRKKIINEVKINSDSIPEEFCLGKGHCKFFYNKLLYLKKRYVDLYRECIRRGYQVENYLSAWDNLPKELMNDYEPKPKDLKIIRQRIKEKLNEISKH